MSLHRILFVDDDPHLLQGLRRSLRNMRQEWQMEFAGGGKEALRLQDEEPFDAIVSDMRMPGMSGADLLEVVRRRNPDTVRIILSGYSDQESILRTVGPAHQYLAKPCENERLIEVVRGALKVREMLADSSIRAIVTGSENLPSLPDTYTRLVDELASEDSSAASVAAILEEDIALTAETLKLTNSAYFGLPNKISNLQRAVQFLGFETLKAIALVAGLYRQATFPPRVSTVVERLSERSIELSLIGKSIAQAEGLDQTDVDLAACSTVLCHIGTLILISNWPDRFDEAMALVESEGLTVVEAERRVFGVAHPELGAYLLGLWGFTGAVVEAVAYHHEPSRSLSDRIDLTTVVYIAQGLPPLVLRPKDTFSAELAKVLDMEYLARVGGTERIPVWIDKVLRALKPGGDQ